MPIADLGDVGLNYRIHGDPDRPPVLGIMGFALDRRYWAAQIPAVTKTHSFITFDNRGTGRSTGSSPGTIDEMADDAVRLLDHLEVDRTVVFGASMGGTIAQRLTLDHPAQVSALVLAITWSRPIEFMRRQHNLARLIIRAGGPEAMVEAGLIRMFTPEFFELGRDVIDQLLRAFDTTPDDQVAGADALLAQLDAIDKHDVLAELPQVDVPTLVAGARMDQMAPYLGSVEIADAIPNARLVTFETGHGCMIEEMEAFNDAVSEFLASLVT